MYPAKAIFEKLGMTVLALSAGFLGSVLHDWTMGRPVAPPQPAPGVIRAKRFEVVDASGRALSFWGPDDDSSLPPTTPRGTLLVFLNARRQKGIEFGSRSGDLSPTLRFYDRNDRERVRLAFAQGDDPYLGFSGSQIEGTVVLGAIESDVLTGKPGDSWGLKLRSRGARASIFSSHWEGAQPAAGVNISDGRGAWSFPQVR